MEKFSPEHKTSFAIDFEIKQFKRLPLLNNTPLISDFIIKVLAYLYTITI